MQVDGVDVRQSRLVPDDHVWLTDAVAFEFKLPSLGKDGSNGFPLVRYASPGRSDAGSYADAVQLHDRSAQANWQAYVSAHGQQDATERRDIAKAFAIGGHSFSAFLRFGTRCVSRNFSLHARTNTADATADPLRLICRSSASTKSSNRPLITSSTHFTLVALNSLRLVSLSAARLAPARPPSSAPSRTP